MKLISKYSQDIIRTPRSIRVAACRHIIDVSINLWRMGFVNTERINPRASEENQGEKQNPTTKVRTAPNWWYESNQVVWRCECDIFEHVCVAHA